MKRYVEVLNETLRELLAANDISEAHILHPGDELIIPASGPK